eukprot:1161015-Rhodomonas_salina.1
MAEGGGACRRLSGILAAAAVVVSRWGFPVHQPGLHRAVSDPTATHHGIVSLRETASFDNVVLFVVRDLPSPALFRAIVRAGSCTHKRRVRSQRSRNKRSKLGIGGSRVHTVSVTFGLSGFHLKLRQTALRNQTTNLLFQSDLYGDRV